MIDPARAMEDVYAAALTAQEAAIVALVDGADLAAPTTGGRLVAADPGGQGAALAAKIKTVGTAIGLEPCAQPGAEPKMRGTACGSRGAAHNVQIVLSVDKRGGKEGARQDAVVMIADTVSVAQGGTPRGAHRRRDQGVERSRIRSTTTTTTKSPRRMRRRRSGDVAEGYGADARRHEQGGPTDEDARRRKQATLADKKNRETHARLVGAQNAELDGTKHGATADFVATRT